MLFDLILLSTLIAGGWSDLSLRGAVRDTETGEPIERVLVEVLDESRHAWSDSLGFYDLPLQSPGPHRVRFTRLGYDPFEIEVVLPGEGVLRLDASLSPRPIALSGVRVMSQGLDLPDGAGRTPQAAHEMGSRSFAPEDWQLGSVFGRADALGVLAASPDVVLRADAPTGLHVRGGSAAENAVLLDGIPIFGAYHTGGSLSAVNPDAVAGVRLHAGVAPARFGGALSSAIEIQTRDVPRAGVEAGAALTSGGARGTLAHSLPGGVGGLLVSGRRSYRPGLWINEDSAAGTFGDLLIKATADVAGGTVDVLSFRSHDELGFDAFVEADELANPPLEGAGEEGGDAGSPGAPGLQAVSSQDMRNRFDWDSEALGLVWTKGGVDGPRSQLRAWRSGFRATIDWAAEGTPLRLHSARTDIGLEGAIEGAFAAGRANAGVRLERSRVRYRVESSEPAAVVAPESFLVLESAPTVLTVFAEDVWSLDERFELRAGLRGRAGSVNGPGLEPRLSLAFAPTSGLVLSAGYARTVQDVQSLRNEESILDAVVGIDLPVAADGRLVPTARSDQLTAAAEAWLGGTRVSLEGYTRWLEGLVLVAPATSQPFALQGFETGSGRASGATLLIERRGPRLSGRAAFAFGTATRRADAAAYHPGFERGRSVSLMLDYHVAGGTRLQTGLLAASGSPTSLVAGPFLWDAANPLGGAGEIEGSPQRTLGPLNGESLPSYVRWDVAVRQEWAAPWSRAGSILAASVGVANVLNQQNPLAYVLESETNARRGLSTLPRSLAVGLEWRY